MSGNKYPPLTITDSPAGFLRPPISPESTPEKGFLNDRTFEKLFGSEFKSIKERNRIKKIFIGDISVNEIVKYSRQKISLNNLSNLLKTIQEIKFIWSEMVTAMRSTGEMFRPPYFEAHDRGLKYHDSTMSAIKEEEGSQVQQNRMDVQNQLNFSMKTKIEILKMKKYCRVWKKKLLKFLKVQRAYHGDRKLIFCKFCGEQFESGRHMGGHMSRHHPGKSQEYKAKVRSRMVNREQKNRRIARKKVIQAIKQSKLAVKIEARQPIQKPTYSINLRPRSKDGRNVQKKVTFHVKIEN